MRHDSSVPSWLENVLHVAARGIDLAVAEGANVSEAKKRQTQSAANLLTGTKHVFKLAPQTFLLAMTRTVASIDDPTYFRPLNVLSQAKVHPPTAG